MSDRSRPRARQAGQAALELLAAVPVLVLAVLVAWQLVLMVAAVGQAQDRARAAALAATGPPGALRTVAATATAPRLLPGPRLTLTARAAVRLP